MGSVSGGHGISGGGNAGTGSDNQQSVLTFVYSVFENIKLHSVIPNAAVSDCL